MTLLIGSHVSFKKEKQLLGCVEEIINYGGNSFMLYTGAPQNTSRLPIDKNLTLRGYELMKNNNMEINNVFVHAPYIINLANKKNINNYHFSIKFLKEEIKRCDKLGVNKLILHPGSHVGEGIEIGIKNIINALNEVIEPEQKTHICLEIMSGKGSECGSSFLELKEIIDNIDKKNKILVCLDTCHLFDAGYNLNDFDAILDEFDELIGLSKLACIHINDSKNIIGSKKDRHANIGFGNIGFDTLIKIIYNRRIANVPKILETPFISEDDSLIKVYPPYKLEIEMIKKQKLNKNLIQDIRKYYQKTK